MSLIPWEKIAAAYTRLITDSGVKCNIYKRTFIKNARGEDSESITLVKSNVDIIFLNNSGNANIYSAGIINNAVILNSSHSGYILFPTDLTIEANKHILEVQGKKYNINFVNDFASMHFGLQLGCEIVKTGVANG